MNWEKKEVVCLWLKNGSRLIGWRSLLDDGVHGPDIKLWGIMEVLTVMQGNQRGAVMMPDPYFTSDQGNMEFRCDERDYFIVQPLSWTDHMANDYKKAYESFLNQLRMRKANLAPARSLKGLDG